MEALLTDETAADQVRHLWDCGLISDDLAAIAWLLIANGLRVTASRAALNLHLIEKCRDVKFA